MCGIAGIYSGESELAEEHARIDAMMASMAHRGPDDKGIYRDGHIVLGHVRLSIIDLEGGAQPIRNEDETIWVVFNGEIFNFIELRQELVRKGHTFYTKTDTEVLVHLYEEYGDDFVNRLNGQFAIAMWDRVNQRLLLTRDRVGILPLFYSERKGRLYFASEAKSLLAASRSPAELDAIALDQLMTFWAPISPRTIFKGVSEVSPGELVVVERGAVQRRRYWDWSFPTNGQYAKGSEEELSSELHELLVDATRIRLRADVPVGAYLSGGLDSSALVALIHHYGGVSLRTFSIGFEDKSLDESRYQDDVIRHLGTDHVRTRCGYQDVADSFLESIWNIESPVLRTAPVPMGRLSGLVRESGYKVVLTGEGSDEVLGGYDIFKESKIRQFWSRQRQSELRPLLLKRLYPYLQTSQAQTLPYLRNFFGMGLEDPDLSYFSHIPRWVTTARCKEFFSIGVKETLTDSVYGALEDSLPNAIHRWDSFNRAQYIEAKTLLAGYLLSAQGDRMLMRNSVEGRFPFLDHRLIEFANQLDPRLKMKVLNEKYLLKRVMGRHLPESVISRYKQPYRAPDIAAFFHGQTPEYVYGLMNADAIRRAGYFDPGKVEKLLKKAENGRAIGYKDNMAFVGILSTQAWHHLFVERGTTWGHTQNRTGTE